jgi:hypothetical protein
MSWRDRWRTRPDARDSDSETLDPLPDPMMGPMMGPMMESLISRSRALPRSLEPQRDLWSGIENRISGRASTPEPSPWSLTGLFPRPLAAAAVAILLVATTAISVWSIVQSSGAPTSDVEMAAIAARLRERDGVDDVHQSIVAILDLHRADLPTETIAVLDENLRSIDRAIAEIHLALESNPDHHALGFLLAEAYRSEADLLERLEWWLQNPSEATS